MALVSKFTKAGQAGKKIRVMVVDDSLLARKVIMEGLSQDPEIEIAGYAINAIDAKNKVARLNPDVMTLDVQMPGMTGMDFLKQLLPEHPLPVVLCSSLNLGVFDALHAGAVDFVRKPDTSQSNEAFIATLTQKVHIAARARVQQQPRDPRYSERVAAATQPTTVAPPPLGAAVPDRFIIGLGASTGGTEATLEVLKRLPEDIPGMVITQHMPTGFTKMYAERLDRLCKMEVREAKDGDEIRRGLALVAPADLQMRVMRSPMGGYRVSCQPGEKVSGHRPSVDALFFSMAQNVQCKMVGIIMTGMGADGAKGLLEMRQKGAYTIGQDKESCVVYGMPGVANDIGAVMVQASCQEVANVLLRHLKTK
ncbi:MAG: chemotaxis response regulator protein-glutamate methylesterase [Ruminococcaceae bacterium]|nr:chemotaxis response regulator protein-glutamate methylesterase [Oscillospiraceae bacterium]